MPSGYFAETPYIKQMGKPDFLKKGIVVFLWLGLIVLCIIYRNELTIERIVNFTPEDTLLAIFIMLALFTLKGSTVFMNGNVLYAACGVMFSLPVAVTVNMAGTAIMTTIPFCIGRKGGSRAMEKLTLRYKKLRLLRDAPKQNEFFFTLILRLLGLLPCEIVGVYLGSCKLRYINYIGGTLLGLLPAAIAFGIIGEYASEPSSPQFIGAIAFQITTTVCTLLLSWRWRRKNRQIHL